jgi:hypothetical protein
MDAERHRHEEAMTEEEKADEVQWSPMFAPTLRDAGEGQQVYLRCGCRVCVVPIEGSHDHASVIHSEVCQWHGGYRTGQPKAMPWDTLTSPDPPRYPRFRP